MEIGKDIAEAKRILEAGDVVGFPTETVYGLAGNAFDSAAVSKIFEAKNRPTFNPLIVHTDSIQKAASFVTEFPDKAKRLAAQFWPGPLTLLLPKSSMIADLVTSGSDLVAVRIPNHPVALNLLASLNFPLCAPSANKFGALSPTEATAVQAQLDEEVMYTLDGGRCEVGIESTIIGFDTVQPIIYRVGGLSVEAIEAVIGGVHVHESSHEKPKTSGMMKSHYAPSKPFYVGNIASLMKAYSDQKVAVLSYSKSHKAFQSRVLSGKGDLREAARNLFTFMRELDQTEADVILSELVPNEGLGRGINDRLTRADHRNK